MSANADSHLPEPYSGIVSEYNAYRAVLGPLILVSALVLVAL